MKQLLLLLLSSCLAFAAPVNVTWDAPVGSETPQGYNLYQIDQVTGAYSKVNQVLITGITFTIPDAQPGQRYVLRSYIAPWESGDSNILIVPNVPIPPTGFKFVVLTIEGSTDMVVWTPIKAVSVTVEDNRNFYRLKY
jgi:hypothetical protein